MVQSEFFGTHWLGESLNELMEFGYVMLVRLNRITGKGTLQLKITPETFDV
jgi:hypothetical protein